MIIEIQGEHPQPRRVEQAVKVMRDGGLVAYPTDTVYAIGGDLRSKAAAELLYRIKDGGRKEKVGTFLSVIVPDLGSIAQWAIVEGPAYRLLRKATPGPYTFILPASREVPKILLKKQATIGIRVPDAPVALALCRALDGPMLTTTAQRDDGELLYDPREIEAMYRGSVGLVLDAGPISPEPSTVIDLSGPLPEVLRRGKGDLGVLGLE
jgi:tRNA threonylcarbamoyl adenosine modification protein (Sua5/YciO/YrdC/YwlC family)